MNETFKYEFELAIVDMFNKEIKNYYRKWQKNSINKIPIAFIKYGYNEVKRRIEYVNEHVFDDLLFNDAKEWIKRYKIRFDNIEKIYKEVFE